MSVMVRPPETTRFAPSPTGFLHFGHAYAAWFAWQAARDSGGAFLLRQEDILLDRCRPEYAEATLEDLAWLGLHWDGPVEVQSRRLPLYQQALDRLIARGLAYPCFCSRAEILREIAQAGGAPHGPDGGPVYPGTCRGMGSAQRQARLAAGAPHAWRLNMAAAEAAAPKLRIVDGDETLACAPAEFGDVVLWRRDTPASYHLCVTYDDAAQGITLVTRAEDLRPAAHLHALLQHLLGWPTPRYRHHALLHGADGKRLSKRDGAVSLRALRAEGVRPEQVLAMARNMAGMHPAQVR
jgi:glutamyl-Q tRNA(Asp) synthetase